MKQKFSGDPFWPGRTDDRPEFVALNLTFAGLSSQELGVLRVGPLVAERRRLRTAAS